jgi:hypothetical protein
MNKEEIKSCFIKLCELIRKDRDDSEEANETRDILDVPLRNLSQEERKEIQYFSENLYLREEANNV